MEEDKRKEENVVTFGQLIVGQPASEGLAEIFSN